MALFRSDLKGLKGSTVRQRQRKCMNTKAPRMHLQIIHTGVFLFLVFTLL